jgi:hypothetical protein
MDNGSSSFANIPGQDLPSLFLDDNSKLMDHCRKHNIRTIHIRCLSDILQMNTALHCSSNEVQQFSWATCFNADCTFSSYECQHAIKSTPSTISVKKHLQERMIELDALLYEACDSYKGRLKYNLFTYMHLSYVYIFLCL